MSRSGFTLVEIMVVVVIIGILAGIVVGSFTGHADEARMQATKASIANISTQIDLFRIQQGRYPNSLDELVNKPSDAKTWGGGYMKNGVPLDGWSNKFIYKLDASSFTILSYGADGKEGGDDINKDISNKDAPENK